MKHRQLWVINVLMNPLSLLISFGLSFPNASLFVVTTLRAVLWSVKLLLLSMLSRIKALSAAAINPFANLILALDQLSPPLDEWLQQASIDPDKFACEAFYCSDLADQFPCLVTRAVPPSVSCTVALSPLMDMRYLHAWRLLLDSS
jgi:hypothetical protein